MGRPKVGHKMESGRPVSHEKKTRGKRYTDAEKAQILEQALAEIKNDGQITKIADNLGVTFFTLKSWLKEAGSKEEPRNVATGKRGRGRPPGVSKKKQEITTAPTATQLKNQASKKKADSSHINNIPDYIQNLERKLEELTHRYINLAHLYGEIVATVGPRKL